MSGKQAYILVLDVGTGSGRASLFDLEGELLAFHGTEWAHKQDPMYRGALDFDVEKNWALLKDSIQAVLSKGTISPADVKALGVTSMRHGMVCFNGSNREIVAFPNADARAEDEVKWLINEGLAEKIHAICGDWPNVHNVARLLWLKRHKPGIFDSIERFTMLEGWPLVKLCGKYVADASSASSSGMLDIRRMQWSEEIIRECGLPAGIFPEIRNAGFKVGELDKQVAQETGLPQGTPVILTGGDTQCGLVGSGVIDAGSAGIVAGTFWLDCLVVPEPIVDERLEMRTSCHVVPGKWIIEGVSFVGMIMRWFRDALCESERKAADSRGTDTFRLLDEAAGQVPPGAYGLQVCMSNVFNTANWVHSTPTFINWDVWDVQNSRKAVFFRALMENVAYQSKGEFGNITRMTGIPVAPVVFCGGGAKSRIWPQILADVLDSIVHVPKVNEATALGAAICAAVGAGYYADIRQAVKQMVKYEQEYKPTPKNTEIYLRQYEQWRLIYEHMLKLAVDGTLNPLWKVAGT